jgi:DNA-binding SARP family transcriptional activator
MSALRISLFGKLHVQSGEHVLTSLSARKAQELFCYLLLYRDRPHPRETLAGLLWGDSLTARSKKYLRQALWQLQAALECQSEPTDGRLLIVELDWVQLNAEADLWLDVAVFEQAFGLARGTPGRELDVPSVQALQRAAQLYRGDLLEGWYQDWCLYERERLQNMYLAMLDKLMGHCEAHRDYERGLAYGTCILRYDRARERTHRRMMRLHCLAGDRTAALRQYERCVVALDEELGVDPATRTVALGQRIRADRLDSPTMVMDEGRGAPRAAASMMTEVLEHLTQLRAALADAQRQVQQDIQAIERAMTGRS